MTEGVDIEGNKFRVEDDWSAPDRAHKLLDLLWAGHTTFKARNVVWSDGS